MKKSKAIKSDTDSAAADAKPWHEKTEEWLRKEGFLQAEPIPEQLKHFLSSQQTKNHREGFADGVIFAQLGGSEVQSRWLRRLEIALQARLHDIQQRLKGIERVIATGYAELPVEFVALTDYTEGFTLGVAETKQWLKTHPAPKGRGNDITDEIMHVLYHHKKECERLANIPKLADFILGHFRNERTRKNILRDKAEKSASYLAFVDQVRTWCKRLGLKLAERGRQRKCRHS